MWSTKLKEFFHETFSRKQIWFAFRCDEYHNRKQNKTKGNVTRKECIWLTLAGYSSSLEEVWAVVQAGTEAETTETPTRSTHICLGMVLPTVVSFFLHQLPMKTAS